MAIDRWTLEGSAKVHALAELADKTRAELVSLILMQHEEIENSHRAIDRIYGHNDAARVAVIEHYGTRHNKLPGKILAGSLGEP